MNAICAAEPCPVILNSTCVFYRGANLVYTGILTNDNLQTVIEKIDKKFKDAGLGYIFNNGVVQAVPGGPVQLGGSLIQNTTITSSGFDLTITGDVNAGKFATIGGTSSQFVKGDGSLDSTSYQTAGNYITSLTGDGTASGPGSAVFTLSPISAIYAGTWGSSTQIPQFTLDSKGRITSVSNVAMSIPPASLSFTGDVFGSGVTGSPVTLTINNTNPNIYGTITPLKFSVNNRGLITGASPITNLDLDGIYGYTPVPSTRTLTINGQTYDLSANRSWTIAAGGSVTGSGTLNYISKWTPTGTALGDSQIFDNGSGVMVNTTTYNDYKFDVNGSARVQTNLVVGPINSILVDTAYALRVNTPLSGSVNAFGVFSDGESQSDVTNNTYYFRSFAKTAAASFTLANVNHFAATQGTFGLGSTVTNQYGFRVFFSLTGATNNYGFYGDIGASANNWNLYMNGTAKNYLAGNTLIGGTTDAGFKLDVTGTFRTSGQNTLTNLAGSGTRMVVASSTGVLSTQTIPTGTVTSVAALTLGTTGTDLSSSVANGTTAPVITLNVPTASATNRGALSSGDWIAFNGKQDVLSGTGIVKSTAGTISYLTDNTADWDTAYVNRITSLTTTGSSGSATLSSNTLNVPTYTLSGLGGQPQLNGTGFVKASGTTISYDNSTYLPTSSYEWMFTTGLQALGSTIKGINLGTPVFYSLGAAAVLTSTAVRFVPYYLANPATITGVKFYQANTANYTGNNYNGVGLYSYSGGTLTLVASSTNASNFWINTANTWVTKAFSSPYSAPAGVYYIGMMYSFSAQTTAPQTLAGSTANVGFATIDLANSAKVSAVSATGQTVLPSSIAMSSINSTTNVPLIYLY